MKRTGKNNQAPRHVACLLLAFLCFMFPCRAYNAAAAEVSDTDLFSPEEIAAFPPMNYDYSGKLYDLYESDTLIIRIETFTLDHAPCLLSKIWVQDPEKQIRKANAPWGESLARPAELAAMIPEAVLVTNASGYITKNYPDLPESYPGTSSDYYFTTLGSVVITEGETLRYLEGVPFYGLALSEDGISLYCGADPGEVMAASPVQTWAFFETCAMQIGGENTLPEEGTWPMARERHTRTVLARINRNNYLLLHVCKGSDYSGLSLYRISDFFSRCFQAEWVYNLDGGNSSSLLYMPQNENARMKLLVPGAQQIADILCFTE